MRSTLLYATIAGMCAALFAVLTLLVSNGITDQFDHAVLLSIHTFATPSLDVFFKYFTEIGGVIVLSTISVAAIGVALLKRRKCTAVFIASGMGGVMALNLGLKFLLERPRPDLWQWVVTESNFSFPSGHATATMAIALIGVTLLWHTKWRPLAVVVAGLYVALVGFSRLYLGVHYPTDIIAGWLLGATWVSALLALYAIMKRHKETGV